MLLIIGLRAFFRAISQGTFHCRRCGGDRPYVLKSGRRWIHLFFIPVIPLDHAGEFVRCEDCGTRYHTDVLALPTMAQMQAALPAGMRAAAITMLRAGDASSGVARRRAIDAVRGAGVAGYDDVAVDADLEQSSRPGAGEEVAARLDALAGQLAVPAREWFLAEIVRIGLADGGLTEAERQAAREMATGLQMTPAQAVGVITLTVEGASAG